MFEDKFAAESSDPKKPDGKPTEKHRRKRLLRRSVLLSMFFAILAFVSMPWIIAATPLRNVLMNRVLADADMHGKVGGASIGWFSPVSLTDLEVRRADGSLTLRMSRFESDRSWWRILMSRPDLGQMKISGPELEVLLAAKGSAQAAKPTIDTPVEDRPTFAAFIRDARLIVRTPDDVQPVIDIEGFNIDLEIIRNEYGRELVIEPQQVFDHQPLSPELCEKGIQLVAPILADSATAVGSVSFSLEKFRLALDDPDDDRRAENTEIAGELRLHQVEAGIKSPLLMEVAGLASKLFGRSIPSRAIVTEESAVQFHFHNRRIHHAGLSFMLPEIAPELVLSSEGSVGLDESIELKLSVPLPLTRLHDGPLLRRLSEQPLELHVAGTLKEPRIKLPDNRDWLSEVLFRLTGTDSAVRQANHEEAVPRNLDSSSGQSSNESGDSIPPRHNSPPMEFDSPDAVVDTVSDLVQLLRESRQENAAQRREAGQGDVAPRTPMLDRLRNRRQQRLRANQASDAGRPTADDAVRPRLLDQRQRSGREF